MALPETESLASDAYRAAARRGDVKAHYYMGLMYEHGEGVPQYPAVAAEWHRRAAGPAGDFAPAQACLGAMYHEGRGVPRSEAAARHWQARAAAAGDADAAVFMARMHDEGCGVAQDSAAAARWWRIAAEQKKFRADQHQHQHQHSGGGGRGAFPDDGDVLGMYKLGIAYARGKGVERNLPEALRWLKRVDALDASLARDAIRMVLRMRRRAQDDAMNDDHNNDGSRSSSSSSSSNDNHNHNHNHNAPQPLRSLPSMAVGTRVELREFPPEGPEAAMLEGAAGTVVRFVAATGKCSVRLEDGRGPFNLKPENLFPIPRKRGTTTELPPRRIPALSEERGKRLAGRVLEGSAGMRGTRLHRTTTTVTATATRRPV